MLTITSPRVARALAAGRLRSRSRRRAAWGSFRQRTVDRRYCNILFVGSNLLARPDWYCVATKLAGGIPSPSLCWVPFNA